MISTKGRYAIRLMIDLAQQNSSKPVSLDSIAQRQNISKKYLESIVKMLVTAELVKGVSGKGGGYLPMACSIVAIASAGVHQMISGSLAYQVSCFLA